MYRCLLIIGIIWWSYGIGEGKRVMFGIKGGAILQNFSEEKEKELWFSIGGLAEINLPGAFGVKGNLGINFYRKTIDSIRVTKSDFGLEVGPRCLWRIGPPTVGVYGGEVPTRFGISSGVLLALHYYNAERKYPTFVEKEAPQFGIGILLFGGGEYTIGLYTLFIEIGWGKIFRGDIFQEEKQWTQFTFTVGAKF